MNYTKKNRQLVCKKIAACFMAASLVALAACSTDGDKSVAGGAAEETGVVAYNNISLKGRAYYAPAKIEKDGSLEDIDASLSVNVFGGDGRVTLKELDSTTLEWSNGVSLTVQFDAAVADPVTGELIPTSDGIARFDSVSLSSPVVQLIASSGSVSLDAIIDLRDSNSFVIDALSHLTAGRLRKLVASGKTFTSAKIQAETEMANVFGISGQDASGAASVRNMLNELPFELLQTIKDELAETGAVAGLSEGTKNSIKISVLHSPLMKWVLLPESVFEMLGDDAVLFYQENLKMKQSLLHVLASVYGYNCSSANEGELVDVSENDVRLKCREGAWELVDSRAAQLNVSSTLGAMVDSRDGQAYKTVTLELDGISQTWMAENLNYVTEKSSCFRDDSSYCSVYGRMYSIFPLDSIYNKYASEEDCIADRMNVWLAEYRAFADSLDEIHPLTESDSLMFLDEAHRLCKELHENPDNPDNVNWSKVIDSLEVLKYDVCPEGWRMPTYEDWDALLTHIDYDLLHVANGDPVGFGLKTLGWVFGNNGRYRMRISRGASYLFKPRPTPEEFLQPGMPYVGDAIGMVYTLAYELNNGFMKTAYTNAMWSTGFVRCIKND